MSLSAKIELILACVLLCVSMFAYEPLHMLGWVMLFPWCTGALLMLFSGVKMVCGSHGSRLRNVTSPLMVCVSLGALLFFVSFSYTDVRFEVMSIWSELRA